MSRLALLPLLALCACLSADPTPSTVVFKAGETDKYPSIRIPALLCTAKGTLLAAAEGRNKAHDQAENDYILRRSTDNGKTWAPSQLVLDEGATCLNNPCLVQDARSGRIFLFFQTFPPGNGQFSKGVKTGPDGPNKIGYVTSDDDGLTWSKPVDASSLKPDNATTTASGPGIGVQLTRGPKAGRLVIPFNSKDAGSSFVNWVAYSDDGGKTWKRGKDVPQEKIQLNEVQVSETSNGGLYLNSRQWKGTGGRKVAWSKDGGETWTPAIEDKDLPEPVCQGCVLSFKDGNRFVTLFLNPEGNPPGKGRSNGTLRLSLDDGKTWKSSRLIVPGPFAYSSMARLKDGTIGVLYEPNSNTEIRFLTVDLPWLESNK